jgi:hypothetical protein
MMSSRSCPSLSFISLDGTPNHPSSNASGSGATLNETAAKLKKLGATEIFGYAITGSMNGFEVIREV